MAKRGSQLADYPGFAGAAGAVGWGVLGDARAGHVVQAGDQLDQPPRRHPARWIYTGTNNPVAPPC
jgi:hypothetical protein